MGALDFDKEADERNPRRPSTVNLLQSAQMQTGKPKGAKFQIAEEERKHEQISPETDSK